MTDGTVNFMGFSPHGLQNHVHIADAVSAWLKNKYPAKTANNVAADLRCDVRTAENIVGGHLSAVNLTKLCQAYGWSLLAAVGAAVIGETYDESVTRELKDIANERRELEAREASLRSSYARLRARRSVDDRGLRLVGEEDRYAPREDRRIG
jgi:hypothetical protein